MLQYISDGGEMLVNDDGNKESALQSSEVLITSAFFFDYVIVILAQIYTLLLWLNEQMNMLTNLQQHLTY